MARVFQRRCSATKYIRRKHGSSICTTSHQHIYTISTKFFAIIRTSIMKLSLLSVAAVSISGAFAVAIPDPREPLLSWEARDCEIWMTFSHTWNDGVLERYQWNFGGPYDKKEDPNKRASIQGLFQREYQAFFPPRSHSSNIGRWFHCAQHPSSSGRRDGGRRVDPC